jgi:membrane-associated protein
MPLRGRPLAPCEGAPHPPADVVLARDRVLDGFLDVAGGSSWTYVVVFVSAILDAGVPIVPSETTLVTASALAASGRLELWLIVVAAAAGAFIGDNIMYLIGRSLGPRLHRSGRFKDKLQWAERQLDERGATIVLVARFIPGGRTATMLGAGALGMPWRRFALYDGTASILWACYGGSIGFIGGSAFEDDPLIGVGLALGLALTLALLIEAWRRRPWAASGA